MRFSLRWQLVATFLAINFLTLGVVAALDAWLAARRARLSVETQLNGLVDTLSKATYQLDDQILDQIEGLTGAAFVLRSSAGKTVAASNPQFDAVAIPRGDKPARELTLRNMVTVGSRPYFHAAVEIKRPVASFEKQTLHIFYSMDAYNEARRDAMAPPLLVSLAVLPLTALVVLALAQRISSPISRLREQVQRIARGDYVVALIDSGTREVRDLSQSVQQMAGMLAEFTEQTRRAERLKALGQVNASLIHQLRNALAGCRLALDIHRRQCANQSEESLQMATRQLTQMSDYVNRFVQVDRPSTAAKEMVDLNQLLRDTVELARPKAEHLGARIKSQVASETLEVRGDPEGLHQVMTNLINNALEAAASYSAPGVTPQVVIRLEKDAGQARLQFGDTGPGVPAEIARQLYEPFATGKPEGLGLGLFVAKTAAEAHAGAIDYRREEGWTWFTVTLPLKKS